MGIIMKEKIAAEEAHICVEKNPTVFWTEQWQQQHNASCVALDIAVSRSEWGESSNKNWEIFDTSGMKMICKYCTYEGVPKNNENF